MGCPGCCPGIVLICPDLAVGNSGSTREDRAISAGIDSCHPDTKQIPATAQDVNCDVWSLSPMFIPSM